MQIPEDSENNDIWDALVELQREVGLQSSRLEKLETNQKKSDYEPSLSLKSIDGMVRTSIRIIIATASVVILLNWIPAIMATITSLSAKN